MSASTETQELGAWGPLHSVRHYLSGRRGWIVAAIGLVALGMYLGWGWLVAAEIAPIVIALAPCAVMCALGLCMNRMGPKACSDESQTKGDRNA